MKFNEVSKKVYNNFLKKQKKLIKNDPNFDKKLKKWRFEDDV